MSAKMPSTNRPMTKRRITFLAVLLFAVSMGITGSLVKLVEDQRRNEKQVAVSTIGSGLSHSLQRQLDRSVSSTYALASLIRQNENHTIDDFDAAAGDMIETYGGIDSLQLAPDGVVSQIYPLTGNEKAIGHDLLEDPARRVEALAAIESRELTLAGPFTLVQGGVAVIGRLPVFVPDDAGGDRFWGFTIALIRLPTLLGAINLEEITEQGYVYELSRVHPDTGERQVFVRSTETDIQNALAFAIETPNGAWSLRLAPQSGWRPLWLLAVEVLTGTLLSGLLAILFYYYLLRVERQMTELALQKAHKDLEIKVQERTEELAKVNEVMAVVDENAKIITSTLDIDEVYEKFALEVKKLVDFDRMNINTIDYERDIYQIKYHFGEEPLQLSVNTTGPLAGTPTGKVADTGQTLLQHDIALGPRSPIGEQFLQMGLRSSVKVPLVSKGRVIGTLGLRRRRVGAYGLWEQAILERLANQIAPAVENARMHEERVQAEEQLSQAQKMESVGQLAGGVAHDFSNLLTVIMGFSQLLLEEAPPESPTNNYLQEIQKATERAANLTNQLLAFSRRQVIEPKVIDLNGLVMNLDNMLRRLIGEDIELVTLPAANLEPVKADPGQIEQVLMNLAVNAQDAMGEGGKLTIETANVTLDAGYVRQHGDASPGRHVMLTVSDTGMGMAEEVQDHIFEPFFTTKEVGKGTGLGLATCFGIVQQSGGHIEVRSEPGRGTSFKVYLPVTEEASEDQPEIVDSSSSAQGQETVLLAEDEPLVRSMAATVLRDRGYEVLQAANGEEALGAVQKHGGEGIDLLLTDVVMPQMGGPELAEKLHASHPNIKVLFISGYIGEYLSQLNTLNTGTEFLAKPYLPETLAVKVREVLDRRAV